MSFVLQFDRVKYTCACNVAWPLNSLYFCRYCCSLRCETCVCHEVCDRGLVDFIPIIDLQIESYYCPQCTETVPTNEAFSRQHKCRLCQQCPRCDHTLAMRSAKAGTGMNTSAAVSAQICSTGLSILSDIRRRNGHGRVVDRFEDVLRGVQQLPLDVAHGRPARQGAAECHMDRRQPFPRSESCRICK